MSVSPALQLLEMAEGAGKGKASFMLAAQRLLDTAIMARFRFDRNDFQTISRRWTCRSNGHGLFRESGEDLYTMACRYGNRPAAISYERWKGRKPFRVPQQTDRGGLRRLYVGAQFRWEGVAVTVTSFNDSAGHLIACAHRYTEPDKWGRRKARITRRFTITPGDLKSLKEPR